MAHLRRPTANKAKKILVQLLLFFMYELNLSVQEVHSGNSGTTKSFRGNIV